MSAQRSSAKALAKLERKKLQLEAMGEQRRAEAEGEDVERKKNWEYSIEDSEKWEKKTAKKQRRSGFEFSSESPSLTRLRSTAQARHAHKV